MLRATRGHKVLAIVVTVAIWVAVVSATRVGITAEGESDWPIDLGYQVDVLRLDGTIAYTERHDLHARGPSDWFDVVVGYDGGQPCAEFFPAQVTPEVEVDEDPFCTPEYRIGELRRWDGTDALQIGFLSQSHIDLDNGLLPEQVLSDWRSLAATPSFAPLPAVNRAAFGPSEALLSPTYLSEAGQPVSQHVEEVIGASDAEPALPSEELDHIVVGGQVDGRMLTHPDYGFPIVGEMVNPATGGVLHLTATTILVGGDAREVTAP